MKKLLSVIACLLVSVTMMMAQKTVTGRVVSGEDGEPIIGASVIVTGTTNGTVTDFDGNFSLKAPESAKTLTVSYVGMESQTVNITGKTLLITLTTNNELLDEVMVVAYGTAKRSAFTGSAVEVKSEDITKHVSSSATSSLVGKVAGIQATSNSGGPGSSPTIRIRGIGSMSASSAPLYIVDGAPLNGNVTDINPNDIESISVLKDASSSAIYGARGANGVIIITTKQAKQGRDAEVVFDAKFGSNSRLVPNYDVIDNPAEYYETIYKGLYNSKYYYGASKGEAYAFADKNLLDRNNGGLGYLVYTVPEGQKLVGTNFKLNPNATLGYSDGEYYYTPDDWYDEAFHNSFRQEYNVSLKGASDKLSYFAGLGFLEDGGTIDHSNLKRYTGRANVTYQAKKWLKFTSNLNFTHTKSEYGGGASTSTYGSSGNLFYIANSIGPIYPLYVRDAEGNIMTEAGRTIYDRNQTNFKRPSIVGNAFGDNDVDRKNAERDVFIGKFQADITPVKGLTLTAGLTTQSINARYNYLYSPFGSNAASDGYAFVENDRYFSTNQQYLANYMITIAQKHNIAVLAGYEQYNLKEQDLSGENSHLFSPFIGELNNALGKADMSTSSSTDTYMTEGFLGRLSYDYDEKYFLSASIRRDASSRFAPGHRWGTFGSVGLAWQLNKESFLKDVDWVNLLKAKVSWGAQGNDDIGGYHVYADRYTTTYNEETGEYNISLSSKGNENLTWEKSKAWNAGVDFSLFNYRLNGTIEFYNRATSDMLYSRRIPLSAGLAVSSYPLNVGSMYNRGLEITLDGVAFKNKDIEVGLNVNLTFNKNKITKLDPTIPETGLTYSNSIIKVGGTIYQNYMLQYAGVEPETGKALYYMDDVKDVLDSAGNPVLDENGEKKTEVVGKITTTNYEEATQYDCGTSLPKVVGGFGANISLYGFDIAAQFAFQLGGQIYDGSYQGLMGYKPGSNIHKDILKSWTEDNMDATLPRWSSAAADDGLLVNSQTPIDYFLTSSNYLSLANLTVGYTLPKSLLRKIDMKGIRVYFSGENLFLLTKRKGLDPRYNYGLGSMTSGSGLISGAYAAGRSITAGISVTF